MVKYQRVFWKNTDFQKYSLIFYHITCLFGKVRRGFWRYMAVVLFHSILYFIDLLEYSIIATFAIYSLLYFSLDYVIMVNSDIERMGEQLRYRGYRVE